ncbi:MAG: VanW family protein, partial [Patescibacteria group bacterium]
LAYLGQVYPRVSVGGVSFGGLTQAQTEAKLISLIADNSEPVILHYQDQSQTLNQEEIDWRYNVKQTAETIYGVGRNNDQRMASFFAQLKSVFATQQVDPVVSFDNQALDTAVSTFAVAVDQPALDAKAAYTLDQLTITKEKVGNVIDRQEVRAKIINSWSRFFGSSIAVQTYFDAPAVILGDKAQLKETAEKLAQKKISLTWGNNGHKTLTTREVKQLIGFVGDDSQPTAAVQKILVARFTTEQAKNYLQTLAADIDQPAVEPQLFIKDGRLAIASIAKEGVVVDLTESADDIVRALNSDQESPTVALTMTQQKPLITEDNLDKLGIVERIGFGQTSFIGSPANRIHNIKQGVSFMQSALIAPGKEFSTVTTLGAVDHTTGYLPELVIKENRTVPEYGGGLCQVSTTLFRSVLSAGLKVMERQNHSYRVPYYEPPVGLDATIYLPKPDFRFLNDTKRHILIQGRVIGNSVIFELWGTSDGRKATVSEPEILSVTKPGDPIYAKTDTLPKGEEKQIERAHDGAVAIAYYTVRRGGKIINQQTFRSVYKAWPARFLVGTGPAKED